MIMYRHARTASKQNAFSRGVKSRVAVRVPRNPGFGPESELGESPI